MKTKPTIVDRVREALLPFTSTRVSYSSSYIYSDFCATKCWLCGVIVPVKTVHRCEKSS